MPGTLRNTRGKLGELVADKLWVGSVPTRAPAHEGQFEMRDRFGEREALIARIEVGAKHRQRDRASCDGPAAKLSHTRFHAGFMVLDQRLGPRRSANEGATVPWVDKRLIAERLASLQ
jgi:hypothetical protein